MCTTLIYSIIHHTCACTNTHTHTMTSRNWVLILVGMKILWEEEGFQFGSCLHTYFALVRMCWLAYFRNTCSLDLLNTVLSLEWCCGGQDHRTWVGCGWVQVGYVVVGDCFYRLLFSTLEQTHWAHMWFYMSEWLFIVRFWISTKVVYLQRWHGWCHKNLLPERVTLGTFCVHHTTMHRVTSCKATYVRCMRV